MVIRRARIMFAVDIQFLGKKPMIRIAQLCCKYSAIDTPLLPLNDIFSPELGSRPIYSTSLFSFFKSLTISRLRRCQKLPPHSLFSYRYGIVPLGVEIKFCCKFVV